MRSKILVTKDMQYRLSGRANPAREGSKRADYFSTIAQFTCAEHVLGLKVSGHTIGAPDINCAIAYGYIVPLDAPHPEVQFISDQFVG